MVYFLAFIGIIAVAFLLWRAFGPALDPSQRGSGAARGPVGPDDDPEFLHDLDRRSRGPKGPKGPSGPDADNL